MDGTLRAKVPIDGLAIGDMQLVVGPGARTIVVVDAGRMQAFHRSDDVTLAPGAVLEDLGSPTVIAMGAAGCLAAVVDGAEGRKGLRLWSELSSPGRGPVLLPVEPSVTTLAQQPDDVTAVGLAVAPACDRVAVASRREESAQLTVVPLSGGEARELAMPASVTAAAFLPNGEDVVVGLEDGSVLLESPAASEVVTRSRLGSHRSAVTTLAVAPNGRYVASVALDQSIRVWGVDAAAGRLGDVGLLVFPDKNYGISGYSALGPKAIAFTQDQRELLVIHVDSSATAVEGWPFFDTMQLVEEMRRRVAAAPSTGE